MYLFARHGLQVVLLEALYGLRAVPQIKLGSYQDDGCLRVEVVHLREPLLIALAC